MEQLRVSGLRKSYGEREVVAGIDLDVRAGECFGLLGPNGAGKTTTLKLCLGLSHPDGGEIRMLGLPVPERAREARARVGIVPQIDNLDPDFTVRENLLVYGSYFGLNGSDIHERIPDLLEFAGLAARAEARIQALSGGMKRRLTLARALINDPDLVFLDEPTTGLDPVTSAVMDQLMIRTRDLGVTGLIVTHDMRSAFSVGDRVAMLHEGTIRQVGSVEEIRATEDPVVRQFIEGRPGSPAPAPAWRFE